jgi:23S rRNA (cytosine1962-C5)-methyltransferase
MATGLILYEDDHLLVVHKPAGINTHKPDVYAPDGIHEWLSRRYGTLSILHRLDKETSGVMVFGKTTLANQSLSRQFESHRVQKEYLLLSDRRPRRVKFFVKSQRAKTGGEETEFEFLAENGDFWLVAARPLTGRTHQIRRHAADSGFPIAGDTKYGGVPAARLMLHARSIRFEHPATGELVTFSASVPAAFEVPDELTVACDMGELLFGDETNAYRLLNTADVVVDWYDGRALVQWQTEKVDETFYARLPGSAVYAQVCTKQKRTKTECVRGVAEERFAVRENGLTYLIGFGEGLSAGIFLDQRENRRRLFTVPLAGKTALNCFAYTCGFSVAAAKAGAVTTSVDLSRNYLEWGKENFRANQLDSDRHDFIFGDVFDWLSRFEKRGQTWDVVLLDPPTFSTTKKGRAFQAERDYRQLAGQAARLVAKGGWLFCSTNQRTFTAPAFAETISAAVRDAGRVIQEMEFATLPFDFRLAEGEKPYLKTFWFRLD